MRSDSCNVLQVPVVVDDTGCNGSEDINFRFTGCVSIAFCFHSSFCYFIVTIYSRPLCLVWVFSTSFLVCLCMAGSPFLVEFWELLVERAVPFKIEVLQTSKLSFCKTLVMLFLLFQHRQGEVTCSRILFQVQKLSFCISLPIFPDMSHCT